MPFVYLLAHAPGDVEQLVLLGQRVFIQTWAGSKKIRGQIPDHAGQWVLPGGAHGKDQDPAMALRAMVLAETGMRLDDPVARTNYDIGEPKLHRLEDRDYNPFTVVEYPFSASGLRRFADAIDGNIQKLSMQDCLFAKAGIPRRTEALEKLGPVLPPQSGWQTFIVKNFYGGTPPGPFNTEVDTLTAQITASTKQSGAWFEQAIEELIPEGSVEPPVSKSKLVGLRVEGATSTGMDAYQAQYGGTAVRVTALFDPPPVGEMPAITWSGATQSAGATAEVALDRVTAKGRPRTVKAESGGDSRQIALTIIPELVGFDVENAKKIGEKEQVPLYAAVYSEEGPDVVVTLKLRPNNSEAFEAVIWEGGSPVSGNPAKRTISRGTVVDPKSPVRIKASVNPEIEMAVIVYAHLTGIEIRNAPSRQVAGTNYSIDYQAGAQATLRGVLTPDRPQSYLYLNWDTGEQHTRDITINRHPISAPGVFTNHTVTQTIGDENVENVSIGIEVVPTVQSLGYESFAFRDNTNAWYSYAISNQFGLPNHIPAQAIAVTDPDTAPAWQHLVWANDSAPGRTDNRRLVYLDGAAAVQLQARSNSANPVAAPLTIKNVQQWPVGTPQIDVRRITFSGGRSVLREDGVNFGNAYGRVWQPGQTVPQTYTRNTNVGLQPVFRVNTAGTGIAIDVRATLFLPLADGSFHTMIWSWNNIASANGATADLAPAAANANVTLPNQVVHGDPVRFLWEMRATGGHDGNWTLFDVTSHQIYLTYADPANGDRLPGGGASNYWTVLKLSCAAADGQAGNAAQLKAAIYSAFAQFAGGGLDPASGDNPGALRAWDNARMTYWTRRPPQQRLNTMLSAAPAGGTISCACGAWAELLIAMFAAHGEATPRKVSVEPNAAVSGAATGFMVSNWTFHAPPPASANAYTHDRGAPATAVAGTATWGSGVVAQNNQTPPERFGNHFIVYDTAGGLAFYDPSYGSPVVNTAAAYVTAASAGLSRGANPQLGFSVAAGAANNILKLRRLTVLHDLN
ncbi:MAG: hypothetical protein JJ959_19725 [Nisaea sp.]|uniref:hypothetical protein n=1 Tax=Nisaea sp. TaxID=2024842 RepID=UPI001B079EA6|nr:hypothetical protein [Nisaea sp.]MBO6562788.1 hypothetical protein [Nisaea sp.]